MKCRLTVHRKINENLHSPEDIVEIRIQLEIKKQQFELIDSWRNDENEEKEHKSRFSMHCDCIDAIRRWSRKKQFLLFSVIILFLFFIAAAIVLLILLLIRNNNNNYHSNVLTTTTTQTTTTSTVALPYLVGYLTKTTSEFKSFGANLTSLSVDNSGYNYNHRLLGYSQDQFLLYNLDYVTKYDMMIGFSDCQILSYSENATVMNIENMIYCCRRIGETTCWVYGYSIDIPDEIIEIRISEDRNSLYVVTKSEIDCVLQNILINGINKSTKIGMMKACPETDQGIFKISTTSYEISGNSDFSYNIISDSGHLLIYRNMTDFYDIPFNLNATVSPIISTTIIKNHKLIALIYPPSRMYVTRQNLISGCVSTLSNQYVDFKYDGEFKSGDWIGEDFMIWFEERQGANIATFQFQWPDDLQCSLS
ncbi:unnamed protein product [Caenorhabditis angaria]|uniref:Uncharacterized protein n=1 Tax=Caenorhabditis angaria TaxID=860376 RepID=A0A9P1IF32_9PELO|nr:unnamed protein product [Caenorhabditis angaria]